MAQETIITDRVRYPGFTGRRRRSREYKLASQNLWAKALSVIGVGVLLLLSFAIFPEIPLIVVGVCTIFLGFVTLIVDRVINNKCKKGNGQQESPGGGGRLGDGPPGRNPSHSTSNQAMENGTSHDIWICPMSSEWPFPPSSPPPVYTPTNPIPLDETIELGPPPFEPPPPLGLPPPPLPLTPPPPLTPLPARDTDYEIDLSDSDEDDEDTVTELPIMFPLRTRRRCISTPPLPTYQDVIEEDRRTLASASSMPSLYSHTSSSLPSSSSSSSTDQSQSAVSDTALRFPDTSTSDAALSNSDLTSTSSPITHSSPEHASRLRATSLPVRTSLENNPSN